MTTDLEYRTAKILIIDDEKGNIQVLSRLLRNAGYEKILAITDSREALTAFNGFQPDLTILDLNMPHLNGLEVITLLNKAMGNTYFPILVLTAQIDKETRVCALEAGASDFIQKPMDPFEALPRIKNLIEICLLHKKISYQNYILEQKVMDRTQQLEESRLEVILRLGRAVEYRDNETGQHVIRMSRLCAQLGEEIGMSERDCQILLHASPLHDVGKIGIPESYSQMWCMGG
jgi:putative two-component system response regulator